MHGADGRQAPPTSRQAPALDSERYPEARRGRGVGVEWPSGWGLQGRGRRGAGVRERATAAAAFPAWDPAPHR